MVSRTVPWKTLPNGRSPKTSRSKRTLSLHFTSSPQTPQKDASPSGTPYPDPYSSKPTNQQLCEPANMSHLIQFPPQPHAAHDRKPPYVRFMIHGQDMSPLLPPRIPLALILSYIPDLARFLPRSCARPPTSGLSTAVIVAAAKTAAEAEAEALPPQPRPHPSHRSTLRALSTPTITMTIPLRIDPTSFTWLIKATLQTANHPLQPQHIPFNPDFSALVLLHTTWASLSLPISGLHNLDTALYAFLLDDGVFLQRREMAYIWSAYPHDSRVVYAMGCAFFRGVIGMRYQHAELSAIVYWWADSTELFRFYQMLKERYEPAYRVASDEISRLSGLKRARAERKAEKERERTEGTVKEKDGGEGRVDEVAALTTTPTPTPPTPPPTAPTAPTPTILLPAISSPLTRTRSRPRPRSRNAPAPAAPHPPLRKVGSNTSISSVETAIYSPCASPSSSTSASTPALASVGWYDTPEDVARKRHAALAAASAAGLARARKGVGREVGTGAETSTRPKKEKRVERGIGGSGIGELVHALEKVVREREVERGGDGEGE